MRILYATERAHVPDRVDGALNAAHALLSVLRAHGHACEAIASVGDGRCRRLGYRAVRAVSWRGALSVSDRRSGYTTRRAWPWLVTRVVEQRIRRFRPDVLLTQLEGSEAVAQLGIRENLPTLVWIHDNEFKFFKGGVPSSPLLMTLGSSDCVSRMVREHLGYDSPVLYPPVQVERCLARKRQPDAVTLINPVKVKGVNIALQVARMLPHRRFLFVETWPLENRALRELNESLADLPNVTLRRWSKDIRPVYERTQVLLAPSQWVEAFCLVVFEANVNGIPVVASRIGGIPATLGKGGVLLNPDAPAEQWAAAIEHLLVDQPSYDRLSKSAFENAARPEFNPDSIADRFLEIASQHLSGNLAVAGPHRQLSLAG